MAEDTYPVRLTKLELVASECATAAVAGAAPSGSPGRPLLEANNKFQVAREDGPVEVFTEAQVGERLTTSSAAQAFRRAVPPAFREISTVDLIAGLRAAAFPDSSTNGDDDA